jgi:hypothetical protein
MEEQDWNTALFLESESNAWGGTQINVADLESYDLATMEQLPERGQGRRGDASELGSSTKNCSRKTRNESDDLLARSQRRPPRFSKASDDEFSRLQYHCPPRSTASKTRVHQQGRRKSMGDYTPPNILEEEFNVNASQIFEFEKQGEQEDAFGTIFVPSTTSYFRKSLETSLTRHKDNSATYEYEEPGDMTSGKKKPSTRMSLDVRGDEYEWASGHGDPGSKRSGRTPRRSGICALPSASMPSSMSNQHVTETHIAISSVFMAPVDAHQSPLKSRRRGSTTGSSSIERHEKRKPDDKKSHHAHTSSGSSNLNAILGIRTYSSPKASGYRSVWTSVTEAHKNSSKARRRNSMNGHYVEEERGALSNNHEYPCHSRSGGSPTHHRRRAASRRSSLAICNTYSSDSHDLYGCVSPVEAQATEQQEKTQKARSSCHRASRYSTSIGSSASPPESHDNSSSGASTPHLASRKISINDASRTTTGFESVRPRRRMPRRSSTGYSETILAATASLRNRGPVTNVADADLSFFDFPNLSECKIDFDQMQMLVS